MAVTLKRKSPKLLRKVIYIDLAKPKSGARIFFFPHVSRVQRLAPARTRTRVVRLRVWLELRYHKLNKTCCRHVIGSGWIIKWINPFWVVGMSADNVLGWEIVLKISRLPSKLRFSSKYSFFWIIFQPRTLLTDIQGAWRGYLLNTYR